MKKTVCLLLLICLIALGAAAGAEGITLGFDEGFRLTLPEGWVSYAPSGPAVRYILGDGSGERFLYILAQNTAFADFDELRAALDAREDCGKASALELDEHPFAAFIMPDQNASGCATLWNGETLVFLFTPQSDSNYMITVAEIMASLKAR